MSGARARPRLVRHRMSAEGRAIDRLAAHLLSVSMRTLAPISIALALCALLAGCSRNLRTTFDAGNSDMTVEEASKVEEVPLFWLGAQFEELPLISISGDGRYGASFIYGDCLIPKEQTDGGCAFPLTIQAVTMCRPQIPRSPLGQRRTLRGVPAGTQGGGLVLLSRRVDVRIFADRSGRAVRAARAIRAVNPGAPGAAGVADPLPQPPAGADKRTPCSATGR